MDGYRETLKVDSSKRVNQEDEILEKCFHMLRSKYFTDLIRNPDEKKREIEIRTELIKYLNEYKEHKEIVHLITNSHLNMEELKDKILISLNDRGSTKKAEFNHVNIYAENAELQNTMLEHEKSVIKRIVSAIENQWSLVYGNPIDEERKEIENAQKYLTNYFQNYHVYSEIFRIMKEYNISLEYLYKEILNGLDDGR